MLRFLRWILLYLPLSLVAIIVLSFSVTWFAELVPRDDLRYLAGVYKSEGAGRAIALVRNELFGPSKAQMGDPSYGRIDVEGKGHSPWVLRGNLDGRPRMLKLAMAPEIWAAYDLESASLYQLWNGSVLFEGSVYDYRHGPQPIGVGAAFLRNEEPVSWYLVKGSREREATVRYLGHDYTLGGTELVIRYVIESGRHQVELHEYPSLSENDQGFSFERRFEFFSGDKDWQPVFVTANGNRTIAQGIVSVSLENAKEIEPFDNPDRGREAGDGETEAGAQVIANSDCLSCHAETHRVAGPAWSEIAQRYGGKLQDEVINALVDGVRNGSQGRWGKVPMTPHPQLSEQQIRDALTYILLVEPAEDNLEVPKDQHGKPYASTRDYDVLPRPNTVHPAFALTNLAPEGFTPKVGGLAFRDDGKLVIASWDPDGAVFLLDPKAPEQKRVQRIAEGLHEPLGVTVVDGRIFVLQKQELTELVDLDGDDVIDRYRAHSHDWQANPNFHSFAFGLLHEDEDFYFLTSICILPGGASCPEQLLDQGKLMQVNMDGDARVYASGFRTPNGLGFGEDGAIYVNDNQGDWLPSSKLVRVVKNGFYGSRAVPDEGLTNQVEKPPVVWLPQDEVGNSPTEPLLLVEGEYAGQMIHGDVYNGGVKRVFMEEVDGQIQGAVFHFSGGFLGSVNRLARGPDNHVYVGEIGNPPNWGESNKKWYGLERLEYQGNNAFEILAVRAQVNGFTLELTQPLAQDITPTPGDLIAKQWFYQPTLQYGGPKYDEHSLSVDSLTLSDDRRSLRVTMPGLKAGYVVYLRLPEHYRSTSDAAMWARETWYTLNLKPEA
ncbi:MAG: c-type cytochrome [Halioglobus sp.]